jgi:peptide/nickel transport system substrate-binding protein
MCRSRRRNACSWRRTTSTSPAILNPEDLASLEANPATRIIRNPRYQYYYLSFNTSDPELSHPKVRLAFRYLIDYQGLEKTIMRYEGVGRASLVPLGAFGVLSREEGLPFRLDLEKAKRLLVEAGYPNGFKKELIVATTFPFPDIAQHTQANATKVGIDLQLNMMASAARLTKVRSREYQISSSVWSSGYPDADAMVSRHGYNPDNRLEAKQNMFPSWNAAWQSDWFNEMWMKSRMEKDAAQRIAMYREIQLRHIQESGMV